MFHTISRKQISSSHSYELEYLCISALSSMPPSPPPFSGFEPSEWDPLVIAMVGIVCTIFLLFSYHRILQSHCREFGVLTFRRNPAGQSHHLSEAIPDDPSLQFQSRGLDSFVMHSLPITQFEKKKEEELCQGSTDCAVCLGEFEDSEWLKKLPNCSHVFHVSCIDTWFQTHSSCPLCRSYVYLTTPDGHSVSMYALLETLRREEIQQERSQQFRILRSPNIAEFSTWNGNSSSH